MRTSTIIVSNQHHFRAFSFYVSKFREYSFYVSKPSREEATVSGSTLYLWLVEQLAGEDPVLELAAEQHLLLLQLLQHTLVLLGSPVHATSISNDETVKLCYDHGNRERERVGDETGQKGKRPVVEMLLY